MAGWGRHPSRPRTGRCHRCWSAKPISAALRALIDASRDGNGRFAAIEGSAGIGKTPPARRDTRDGRRHGAARTVGAGRRAGARLRVRTRPTAVRAAPGDRFGGGVRRAAGGRRRPCRSTVHGIRAARGATGDVSFSILHGLYWLAANAALHQPTLLVVDDLHWADAPSLRWLVHLTRRLDGLPLMVAVGTRPPQQSEQTELLTELVTDPAAVVLRPGTLSSGSIAILARELFAAEPEAEFSESCRRRPAETRCISVRC